MIPISTAISGGLVWSRNGGGYELKLNDNVVGRLRKTCFWSSEYQAETSFGNWRFCRSGLLGNCVEVLNTPQGGAGQGGSNPCAATFKQSWGGPGTFKFADGQTFLVVSGGCWRPVWKVSAADGGLVLHVRTRERTVELEKKTDMPESRWLLLVLFIFYRMQQAEEDGAVAALVAAVG